MEALVSALIDLNHHTEKAINIHMRVFSFRISGIPYLPEFIIPLHKRRYDPGTLCQGETLGTVIQLPLGASVEGSSSVSALVPKIFHAKLYECAEL